MKVLSLFSGVGGFDMGLENAGMETVFQCEWDKHANSILHRHWPDVPKWDDVSTLTGKHILAHAPVIDVVAWGSPCQDLSVAGKRAGLEGGRSGLFHEGIRIIKELQEETNGQYPRISIWENVVGALNSNRGADFGVILDQMAEAGALAIEWSVLDAQHFGIPQRRRRVFVIAIFDPVLANRCPNPLLPVAESLPGHLAKGKPKRKSAADKTATSVGTDGQWWDGRDTAEALTTTSNEQRVSDKQRFQAVVEENVVGALAARDYKGVGNQYVAENKCVVEPYVKSSRAQTSEDTWRPDPSLNQGGLAIVFNDDRRTGPTIHGDTVSTLQAFMGTGGNNTPMVAQETEEPMLIDGQRVGDVRIYTEPVQTLGARMRTEGNNVPMLAFDTQFGSNANVTEDVAPTLKASQQSPSVAYPIDTRNALRNPEKYDAQNRQGLGIGADGDPMSTLTSAHVNAVAYGITGNAIGRQDHNGPNGPSHTPENGPMFTLTSTDIHAVAYDEYNDSINETHHALRAGTKQSTGLLEPTMAVRRLTPLECERLMGWPDDHTRYKADGTEQADTHRYKQCGNGVASPVAQWIAKHILNI